MMNNQSEISFEKEAEVFDDISVRPIASTKFLILFFLLKEWFLLLNETEVLKRRARDRHFLDTSPYVDRRQHDGQTVRLP